MTLRQYVLISVFALIVLALAGCGSEFLPPDISAQIAVSTAAAAATPTFTPTLTPTITPTPVPPTATPPPTPTPFVKMLEGLNIRQGPNTDYPIMRVAPANARFAVIGKNADGSWVLIGFGEGKKGWVFAELVEVNDSDLVSVVEGTE